MRFVIIILLTLITNTLLAQEAKRGPLFASDSGFIEESNYFSVGGSSWGMGFGNMYQYSGLRFGFVNSKKLYRINGISISGMFNEIGTMNGISYGLFAANINKCRGINIGGMIAATEYLNGFQCSVIGSLNLKKVNGVSLAFGFNLNTKVNGLTYGLYNSAIKSNGIALALAGIGIDTMSGLCFGVFNMGRIYKDNYFENSTGGLGNGVSVFIFASRWKRLNGLTISPINIISIINGAQIALYNKSVNANGLSIGLINKTSSINGISIGLFNKADSAKGVQFGIWNVIKSNPRLLRRLPIMNVSLRNPNPKTE